MRPDASKSPSLLAASDELKGSTLLSPSGQLEESTPIGPQPRPELRALSPALHGGDAPTGVLDFSTGVSPLPAPPAILAAARDADLRRYPHPTAAPLRAALAAVSEAHPDEIVAGAGAAELIWALARAFVGPGRRALVFSPAFGEYAQAVRASGGAVDELRASDPPFLVPPGAAHAALGAAPSVAFVCRPSNPCLSSMPCELLEELARRAPATLFVVDEAYLPLFDDASPATRRPNVVLLRSLTKVFALPGLRLGYLLAPPGIARAVQAALPPWNVSAPASAAGIAAAAALATVPAVREETRRLRQALAARLTSAATPLTAAGGPFLLFHVADASAFCRRLQRHDVRVRDATSFGLPAHVRVGIRPENEQDILTRAWRTLS